MEGRVIACLACLSTVVLSSYDLGEPLDVMGPGARTIAMPRNEGAHLHTTQSCFQS